MLRSLKKQFKTSSRSRVVMTSAERASTESGIRGHALADDLRLLAKINDGIHLAVVVLVALAPYVLPVAYMPLVLFSALAVLYRYHDYCVFSEVSRALHTAADGCEREFDFFGESVGFPTSEDAGFGDTISSGILMVGSIVASARMSKHYNVPIVPSTWALCLCFVASTYAVVAEVGLFLEPPYPVCSG